MGLFKEVKKPVIRSTAGIGAQITPLRPRYAPKTPPCSGGCPGGSDIRGWLTAIAQAEAYGRTDEQAYELAWKRITERNPLPAVCGRVCPHPCEAACNRNAKDDGAVAINAMERFIGDFGLARHLRLSKLTEESRTEKIAVIGAGPAGLSCAYQLARRGYPVTVFEAFGAPGGMLRYGIPKYRLPREVLEGEIQRILDLGIELKCRCIIGQDIPLDCLRAEYHAVFVGIGAHKGLNLGVPGEDAPNVLTGAEFLNRVNSGNDAQVGKNVAVIGGGDTAIDAARVCRRLGADVTLLYRRTRAEMPAIKTEIEGALEEGIKLEFLAAPVEILKQNGMAVGLKCVRMRLGEPDASGRPRPLPLAGSEFEVKASAIIAAISQEPDFNRFAGLREGKDWLRIDEWGKTSLDPVYAGGDDVGLGLVTIAIAQGRFAAEAMDAWFRAKEPVKPELPPLIKPEKMKLGWYKPALRHERRRAPIEQRDMDREIESGLAESEAKEEARRCLSCGMCMDCETCWMYCTNNGFARLPKGQHYKVKLELCNGCKKCAEECPCGYIEMI
jgi:NADPH-dependent glutamate synthase beta subunit-like oxidoreductase/Pyruvate/2-oxoacid:ferredoxin oxidoreductase delta subunit